jgi:hypothetical protein
LDSFDKMSLTSVTVKWNCAQQNTYAMQGFDVAIYM